VRIAAFVTPHGFGHAARTCAVLAALRDLDPGLEATLYTAVPEWFFAESLDFPFARRELDCDVGMAQKSAVDEDLPETLARLEAFWREADAGSVDRLAAELRSSATDAVLSDVSPLGLLAARRAGLPSILVENFTWDWIYESLVESEPRFSFWVERLREIFTFADLRIQAEPFCAPAAGAVAVSPISRRPRSEPASTRARLGVHDLRPLVLVSMGGVRWTYEGFERWRAASGLAFVVPGGAEVEERRGNLVLLPHHSPVHHPDLVGAADVVVGKLGYSTVAEAVAAGTRFLFPPRPGFREHEVLARFVLGALPAEAIELDELQSGTWLRRLPPILDRPRPAPADRDGAREAAVAIAGFVSG